MSRRRPVWGSVLPFMMLAIVGGAGVLSHFAAHAAEGPVATLEVSASLTDSSCELVLNTAPTLSLGGWIAQDFTGHGGTVAVQDVNVGVGACTSHAGGLKAAIVVTGGNTLNNSNNQIFNDIQSGDAGFMLKEGEYKGPLSGYYDAPGTVTKDAYTYDGLQPNAMSSKALHYTVGFVSLNKNAPSVATVSSTVTFEFRYH